MPKPIMKIYIPRILGGVTSKMLRTTFERLSIGDAYYIDMHRKVNENNRVYYFAFLEIEMFDTSAAKRILSSLNDNKTINLVYDEEAGQYWELKKHIPKNERPSKFAEVVPVLYETYMAAIEKAGIVKKAKAPVEEPVDDFDYDTEIQERPYNMWDDKYNFWLSL
jgi:hypothetical protein